MTKNIFILPLVLLFLSCSSEQKRKTILVSDQVELNSALETINAGETIVLKNGVWNNTNIVLKGDGTKELPIVLQAETDGKVYIEGVSSLKLAGNYLQVKGLFFRNGHSPSQNVIEFRESKNEVANNSSVSNCVILDFNKPQRDQDDLWVQFYGKHNKLDHCYIAGKTNGGPTVRVDLKGNQSIRNFHQIVNNHFGPRPRKGGARGETIQLGSSFTSMSPSNTTIANNFFEECNGEVEIISSKTNFNKIKNNVFYKSEGSVVTRHGNYCEIDGNYFIGDGTNTNFGGIRIVNTGHWITNNYFYNIIGENFRSPLAVMNGIPKSPLNRYNQVTDVVVAYNTYVNCKSPWQFGVGTNIEQKDVLPKSEIRSARPLRTEVANNIIFNQVGDKTPVVEHDKADGVKFKNNTINNQGVAINNPERFNIRDFSLSKISEEIYLPNITNNSDPYVGFGFETITKDLFGASRANNNSIGAMIPNELKDPKILDKSKYGATWYSSDVEISEPKIIIVNSANGDLENKLKSASAGDILRLEAGKHTISTSLIVNKKITIESASNDKAEIIYTGESNSPLFELHPYGLLTVNNLTLIGNNKQHAFANLKENMSNHYGLTVKDCEIEKFNYVLKAYKQTFAEEITFTNTAIKNSKNGIELSEETNDRGDYNTEYLTIDNCQFTNIKSNVIDYYRGGYDESTIGGNLLVSNSTFENCGKEEKNGILLNTRGIVNVNITNNTFKNNPVKLVALLWGAKNNNHSNNTIKNSGKIIVEENLKMKLMY